jgi:hypothetical protein
MNVGNLQEFDSLKIEPGGGRVVACNSDKGTETPIFLFTGFSTRDNNIFIHDDEKPAFFYKNDDKEMFLKKFNEISQFLENHKHSFYKP